MSLLDVLRGVMLDPAEQAAYNADPSAYLGRYGYDDVDPADLSEAFGLVADTLPPDQAQAGLASATGPGDGTFGDVTADFDADPTPADAGGAADAGADVPDLLDDAPVPDSSGDEPALSFGGGTDDIDDLDDPTFGDAAGDGNFAEGAESDGGLDDAIAEADAEAFDFAGVGTDVDDLDGADLDADPLDDAGDDDGHPGQAAFDDPDDVDGHPGQAAFDDPDDVDELDDPGPDDLDIGSF